MKEILNNWFSLNQTLNKEQFYALLLIYSDYEKEIIKLKENKKIEKTEIKSIPKIETKEVKQKEIKKVDEEKKNKLKQFPKLRDEILYLLNQNKENGLFVNDFLRNLKYRAKKTSITQNLYILTKENLIEKTEYKPFIYFLKGYKKIEEIQKSKTSIMG